MVKVSKRTQNTISSPDLKMGFISQSCQKFLFISLLGILASTILSPLILEPLGLFPSSPQPPEPKEVAFTLDNKLRVLLIDRPNSPLVHLVLAVGFGSRDETPEAYGLAHCLEHVVLFRGTRSKSIEAINRSLRQKGAWVNGHTSRDLTLFELSLPAKALAVGLQDFIDLVFNAQLEEAELEQEKEVILEEMNLQASEPLSLAVSIAYENLFPDHPYAHPLIGTKETIGQLTAAKVMEAYHRYYTPANCALTVVGDLNRGQLEKIIRDYFGQLKGDKVSRPPIGSPAPLAKTTRITKELDESQSHLLIAFRAPNFSQVEQYSFDLLTAILGRGLNPLLALALAARRVPLANLAISYYSHQFSGVFLIHLTVEAKYASSAENEALRFLRQLYRENFSPDDVLGETRDYVYDFLQSAKNLVKLNAARSLEDGLSLAAAVASYLLLLGEIQLPSYLETIDRLQSSDLRQTASRYLGRPEAVVVVINQKKKAEKEK